MKVSSLINLRFYFGFQDFFIVAGFNIKFFFNTVAEFIPNIIIFLQQIKSLTKKFAHLVSVITFNISAHFWKHYA